MNYTEDSEKIAGFVAEYEQAAKLYRPRLTAHEPIDDNIPVMFLARDEIRNRNFKFREEDVVNIGGRRISAKSAHIAFTYNPEAAYWMLYRRSLGDGDFITIVQAGELKRVNVIPYSDPRDFRPLHLSLVHRSLIHHPHLREIPAWDLQQVRRVLEANRV